MGWESLRERKVLASLRGCGCPSGTSTLGCVSALHLPHLSLLWRLPGLFWVKGRVSDVSRQVEIQSSPQWTENRLERVVGRKMVTAWRRHPVYFSLENPRAFRPTCREAEGPGKLGLQGDGQAETGSIRQASPGGAWLPRLVDAPTRSPPSSSHGLLPVHLGPDFPLVKRTPVILD